MNRIFTFFIILFLSLSCQKKESVSFDLASFNSLHLSETLRFQDMRKINKEAYVHPKNTWLTIFRTEIGDKRFCLNYKTPYEKKGVLELRQSDGACDHYKGELVSRLEKINQLVVYFKNEEQRVHGIGIIPPFELVLSFYENDKQRLIKIPMMQIEDKRILSRYSLGLKEKRIRGLSFRKNTRSEIFKMSGLYSEKKAIICHKVNKKCQDETPNECSKCPYGSYEVVDFNCKQGGSKYCAPSFCGTRGEPACARGFEFTGTKRKDLCFSGSPAGYCQPGLKTYCDENKILVCL